MSTLGQPPLAAYLPLAAGQNLSDVPDKVAALSNLGTLGTSDIMLNSVPIGTIISFWGSTAPAGYLPCYGQTVNSATYPDLVTFLGGTTSATVPELRGEFLRGWDSGRGVDTGRAIKTLQLDAFASHSHLYGSTVVLAGGTGSSAMQAANASAATTGSTGGTETRPRNVSVLYCIKAYGALINTTTANIAGVLSDLSVTAKLSQFGSSLSNTGYQKLPSGLILQWTTVTIGTSGGISWTYPITFPTSGITVWACPFASSTTDVSVRTAQGVAVTTSSATFACSVNGVAISGNTAFSLFAIGY